MAYFILSLDGGGIRGVLTARLIERLEAQAPFLGRVDLVAGTSTGGILALALAKGLTPRELVSLYADEGKTIFAPRDALDRLAGPADELVRANYDHRGLEQVLGRHFGAATLGDLAKKVLIPTFDLDNEAAAPEIRRWKPKFLHNYESPGNDRAVRAVDAALRTSAAPTYFPSHQGFVDGGVFANNPSTCAVAKAIKGGARLEDIRLLSVGTGYNPHVVPGDHDWGDAQWIAPLLEIVFDGMPGVADYQCEQLLGPRYRRLDVAYREVIALDDVASVPALLAHADAAPLEPIVAWLTAAPGGRAA